MCALVCDACIGLYLSLYRSVFDCIGLVLVNVLASVLSHIEKRHVFGQYLHVPHYFTHTKYQRNTCQYMLVFIGTHCNTYQYVEYIPICVQMYLACIMVYIEICIESVFAHYNSIRMQYQQNIYQYRQVCIEYIPVSIEYMLVCIQYIPPIHTTTDATIHTNIVHVLAITDGANTVFQSLSSCKRLIQIVCSKICWELQCCFIMGEEKIKLIFCHMSPE